MEPDYIPKVGEKVYVLGQGGLYEVVDVPNDGGQVLVHIIGTEFRMRFPRLAITPVRMACPKCGKEMDLVEEQDRTSVGDIPDTSKHEVWKCSDAKCGYTKRKDN